MARYLQCFHIFSKEQLNSWVTFTKLVSSSTASDKDEEYNGIVSCTEWKSNTGLCQYTPVKPGTNKPCSLLTFLTSVYRRSQDFLWGALFSWKKLTTLFSRRPQNTWARRPMHPCYLRHRCNEKRQLWRHFNSLINCVKKKNGYCWLHQCRDFQNLTSSSLSAESALVKFSWRFDRHFYAKLLRDKETNKWRQNITSVAKVVTKWEMVIAPSLTNKARSC